MQHQNYFKHFFTIGLGTLINLLLGLITVPLLTRIVDPNEYGQLALFNVYSSIALMFFCLGLDQSLVRFYYDKTELMYKRALFSFSIKTSLIVCLFSSVMFLFFVYRDIVRLDFNFEICFLLVANIFILIIDRFVTLTVRLNYKSKLYSICLILKKSLFVTIFLLLFYVYDNSLFSLCMATIFSVLIPSLLAIYFTKHLLFFFQGNEKIPRKELFLFGFPFIFSLGITQLFNVVDKLFLSYFCSYADVGIYSSAFSILNIFSVIQLTFNSIWSSIRVEHYTKAQNDTAFFQKSHFIITVIMFFLGINLILFRDVFSLILGEKYRFVAFIIPFLIFNPIMYTISETTNIGIDFAKKSYLHIIVSIVSLVSNVLGNILLVPRYGCEGAALSTGFSYVVFFVFRTFFSLKYYYVDFHLIRFFVTTGVVVLFAFYATFYKTDLIFFFLYFLCVVVIISMYYSTVKYLIYFILQKIHFYR